MQNEYQIFKTDLQFIANEEYVSHGYLFILL